MFCLSPGTPLPTREWKARGAPFLGHRSWVAIKSIVVEVIKTDNRWSAVRVARRATDAGSQHGGTSKRPG